METKSSDVTNSIKTIIGKVCAHVLVRCGPMCWYGMYTCVGKVWVHVLVRYRGMCWYMQRERERMGLDVIVKVVEDSLIQ